MTAGGPSGRGAPAGELHLRPATESDLSFISSLGRHPAVEPFLAPGAWEQDRLRPLWVQGEDDGPGGLYMVELPGRDPVGALGIGVISQRSQLAELTRLMVDPQRRRIGLGLAAVRLACSLVLEDHGFHRLQAETYGDNHAGRRLFKKAGFHQEGIRRLAYRRPDRWVDGVIYGILAEEV